MDRICVVGAGIIGMSTAVAIQQHFPHSQVVVMAEKFSPHLTSDIAAGLIEPYLSGENEETINRWCGETMQHIRDYMEREPNGGAQEMSGYRFSQSPKIPSWVSLMANVHILSSAEIKKRHPLPQKSGVFYTTLYLQPTKYIDYLKKGCVLRGVYDNLIIGGSFLSRGGKIVRRRIESFDELLEDFDCIVNCTGLEAKDLVDDELLHPIRGQIIRVHCPAVKHFFLDDTNYVLLNDDQIILGGTADAHCWDLSVNQETARKILDSNRRNVPALEAAEILSHQVGLRPGRCDVRLEAESRTHNRKKVIIVHNYGHGGSGVTLFWGCAMDVVRIMFKSLDLMTNSKI